MAGTIPTDPKAQERVDRLTKVLASQIRMIDDDSTVSLPALLRLFTVSAVSHCIPLVQAGGQTWADIKSGLMEDVSAALSEAIARTEFVLRTANAANDEDDNG